jgi:hypothetical protein
MEERAEEAVKSEVEDIKGELESGKMKFNKREIKERLESAAEEAIEEVKNEVSGALVLGTTKLGKDFYPAPAGRSSLFFPVVPAAVAAAAKIGALALVAGLVMEGVGELDGWWERRKRKIEDVEKAEDIEKAEGDVKRQAMGLKDDLAEYADDLRGVTLGSWSWQCRCSYQDDQPWRGSASLS